MSDCDDNYNYDNCCYDDCNGGGYYGGSVNNNSGGGFALIVAIVLYPVAPFSIIGYELCNVLSNGLNIAKYGGAIVGLVVGYYFYTNVFLRFYVKIFSSSSKITLGFAIYLFATVLFFVLSDITHNAVAVGVHNLWLAFFKWCLSYS